MNNIDVFDRCTACIFSNLYAAFPVPIDLDFTDTDLRIFDDSDTHADAFDKFVIYEKTIIWLISAGYIAAESVTYDAAHGVVLSPKGLEVLKMPASLEPEGPSFGERIRESIKSGALSAAGNAAKSAITKGLALAVGSA